jgi:hypothetical protein
MIDARFTRGPRDGEYAHLDGPYLEYLIPVPVDPMMRPFDATVPSMPVHVYRLVQVRPDGLHTYLYEGQRDT